MALTDRIGAERGSVVACYGSIDLMQRAAGQGRVSMAQERVVSGIRVRRHCMRRQPYRGIYSNTTQISLLIRAQGPEVLAVDVALAGRHFPITAGRVCGAHQIEL